MDDYKARGKNVDQKYVKTLSSKKKNSGKALAPMIPTMPKDEQKSATAIPPEIIGKLVNHKTFGVGTITEISGASIKVKFDKVGEKKIGYEFCMQNNMLEFI